MESFQQYAQREYSIGPVEFREIELLYNHKDVACVVCKLIREHAETERISAIGAPRTRDSFIHLGAWKALQREADFIQNRVNDFENMLAEYAAQPVEDQ